MSWPSGPISFGEHEPVQRRLSSTASGHSGSLGHTLCRGSVEPINLSVIVSSVHNIQVPNTINNVICLPSFAVPESQFRSSRIRECVRPLTVPGSVGPSVCHVNTVSTAPNRACLVMSSVVDTEPEPGQSPLQNGSAPVSQPTASSVDANTATSVNLSGDVDLVQDVSEIAKKVCDLEKSVPCQLDFNEQVKLHQSLVESLCRNKSDANAQPVSASSSSITGDGVNVAAPAAVEVQDVEAQQSSERLIAKLDSNKSCGGGYGLVMGDNNMNCDGRSPAPASTTSENLCLANNSPTSMNDEQIKALVKELKWKIEYTERMNWLCK